MIYIRNNSSMQVVSRMLASSVLLLAVMTLALFCIQVPASAASSDRMGGGSGGSSESSSNDYHLYDDDDNDNDSSTCNCKTRTKKNRRRPCTICDCYKEKNQGKRKSCADCSCYKEKECSSSSSNTVASRELLTCNCNCNCHKPCECSCHVPVKTNAKPLFIIFCISAVIYVIVEEDTIANNGQTSGWPLDSRWGSVIMIQVGILDKKRVLQRKLNRIGGTSDSVTKTGLNRILKEVVKSLLEHHDRCHFSYLYARYDHLEKYSRPCYRGFLETEIRKFDKNDETFVNVNSIDNEYSVVTLLVLVDGKYLIPSLKRNSTCVNKGDVKTALQTIYSIPRANLEAADPTNGKRRCVGARCS